jgi:hypothetical protein
MHAVAVDPSNDKHIIATTDGGSLLVSWDGGASWGDGLNWNTQLESSADVPWLETSEKYMSSEV